MLGNAHSQPLRRSLVLALASLALLLGLWLGGGAVAQERPAGRSAVPRWEYRTEPWTLDDTTAVLRALTGDELTSVEEMARSLARGNELVDDPLVQAAVQARLQERLATLGAEGWEVFWFTESQAVVGGVLLPAPRVFAKRPLP